jgi:hypothetical protein
MLRATTNRADSWRDSLRTTSRAVGDPISVPVPVHAQVAGSRAVFFFDPDVLRTARRNTRDEIEPCGSTPSARWSWRCPPRSAAHLDARAEQMGGDLLGDLFARTSRAWNQRLAICFTGRARGCYRPHGA